MQKVKKVQYGYWETDGNDKTAQYWLLFDSIEAAVQNADGPVDIFRLEAKPVGRFKVSARMVQIKKKRP